ncbi:hypothetical protein C0989_000703 [Termitomyces sp. Mn162]|nr:hypothetical protein C0989_000703 [Termitomyces sp. Mn162]
MLMCNSRLASNVDTVEEFVLEVKAYENSIKAAVHYSEHSMESQSEQTLLLAVAQSPKFKAALAKQANLTGQDNYSPLPRMAKGPQVPQGVKL